MQAADGARSMGTVWRHHMSVSASCSGICSIQSPRPHPDQQANQINLEQHCSACVVVTWLPRHLLEEVSSYKGRRTLPAHHD